MGYKCAWCNSHIDSERGVYSYTHDCTKYYFCCDKHRQEHKAAHFGHEIAARQAERERRETLRAVEKKAAEERRATLKAIEEQQRKEHEYQEEQRKREREYQETQRKNDRSKWYGNEWARHLIIHPEDAFQCDWQKMTGADCALLMRVRPNLIPEGVDWRSRFRAEDWVVLVSSQSRFAKECPWKRLSSGQIRTVLQYNEKIVLECDYDFLGNLSLDDFDGVIKSCPHIFDLNLSLNGLGLTKWSHLLVARPQMASKCKVFNAFEAEDCGCYTDWGILPLE